MAIQLDALLNKYNFSRKPIELTISFEKIEKEIGFELPDDYKYYLSNFNYFEGFLGPEYLKLFDYDNLLERNQEYGIREVLSNTIMIGNNGSSEFIAIECLNAKGYRVVLSPLIDLSDEYHIEIGASFSDMLDRLNNGIEWFR
jgi:hypothetical protein